MRPAATAIVAFPPMSNVWPPSGVWAASAIQIRFIRRLREIHLGTNTDISPKKIKIKILAKFKSSQ